MKNALSIKVKGEVSMKKRRNAVLAVIMLLSMTIGVNVQAAGCSNFVLYQTGTPKCTVKLCPGGLKRKERQDKYRQTCVRDNGSTYYNYDYKTVYVSCSCP